MWGTQLGRALVGAALTTVAGVALATPAAAAPPPTEAVFGTPFEVGTGLTQAVEFADLDRDGDLDVVRVASNTSLQVLRNDAGTLAAPLTIYSPPFGDFVFDLAVGDVDGDGDPDIVATVGAAQHTLVQDANGTWTRSDVEPTNEIAREIVLADFDGDGDRDTVVRAGTVLRFLRNEGGGVFFRRGEYQGYEVGLTEGLAAGQFLEGPAAELVAFMPTSPAERPRGSDRLHIFRPAEGTFRQYHRGPIVQAFGGLAVGDLNRDGWDDVVSFNDPGYVGAEDLEAVLEVRRGMGAGALSGPVRLALPEGATLADVVTIGEVTGDAAPDVVTYAGLPGHLLLTYAGRGDGTFASAAGSQATVVYDDARSVAVTDWDRDGRADLVGAGGVGPCCAGTGHLAVTRNLTPRPAAPAALLFGNGPIGRPGSLGSMTLVNPGPTSLRMGPTTVVGPLSGQFRLTDDGCDGEVLRPGQSCIAWVQFLPSSPGLQFANVRFTHSGFGGRTEAGVSGFGTDPEGEMTPSTVDFGNAAIPGIDTAQQVVTVESVGSGPLRITGVKLSGPHAADYRITANGCGNGRLLPEGTTCQIRLVLRARGLGRRTASLRVTTDGRPQTLVSALTGATLLAT